MDQIGSNVAIALIVGVLLAAPAAAQDVKTVKVERGTVVLEQARGDSFVLGSVRAGEVLEVLDRQGSWYLVTPPAAQVGKVPWTRGWIHASALDAVSQAAAAPKTAPGRLMIRGFGHAGGTLFTARDSFDAILGTAFGSVYGAGGQVTFPNGVFAQVSADRFSKSGSRVLVSDDQLFTLPVPTRIVVRPIQATIGYRPVTSGVLTPYFGVGAGWHQLEEETPSIADAESISKGKVGYHVLGGAEVPVLPWVWLAGEVQWAAVPKSLGETGVSAVYQEKDLGGTTFRVKVMFGY